jgi:hypothetical protein
VAQFAPEWVDQFEPEYPVLSQSAYMKRNYVGFELNKKYIDMFTAYLNLTYKENRKEYNRVHQNKTQTNFEKNILNLRALKYAKIILSAIQKKVLKKDFKVLVTIKDKSVLKNKLMTVQYDLIGDLDKSVVSLLLNEIASKRPLSKFGIEPNFKLVKTEKMDLKGIFFYSENNTHCYIKDKQLKTKNGRILSKIKVNFNENDYL